MIRSHTGTAKKKAKMLKDTEDTRREKPIFTLKTTGRRDGSSFQSTRSFETRHPISECAVKVLTVRRCDSVISELTAATAEKNMLPSVQLDSEEPGAGILHAVTAERNLLISFYS